MSKAGPTIVDKKDTCMSETGRIRFRRVRFQTPSSVSFLALIALNAPKSAQKSANTSPQKGVKIANQV